MASPDDREALVLNCNKVAMDYLREDDFKEALVLLKKAEAMLNSPDSGEDSHIRLKLLGITFNNFGCFYKRKKQPNVALYYLKQALDIEVQQGKDNINLAGTHLNICAIYSQLGKHSEALQHAYDAFKLVETVPTDLSDDSSGRSNAITTLIIAYHNVAVELEFLSKLKEALDFYTRGLEVATSELGASHGLTKSLVDNKAAAMVRFRQLSSFSEVRKTQREQARVPSRNEDMLLLTPARTGRSKSSAKPIVSGKRVRTHLPAIQRKGNQSFQIDAKPSFSPEVDSFHSYRALASSKETPQSHEALRKLLEEGVGSTRKHFAPVEKMRMYLTPSPRPV